MSVSGFEEPVEVSNECNCTARGKSTHQRSESKTLSASYCRSGRL